MGQWLRAWSLPSDKLEGESLLCLPTAVPRASHFPFLDLSFSTCKMGVMMVHLLFRSLCVCKSQYSEILKLS